MLLACMLNLIFRFTVKKQSQNVRSASITLLQLFCLFVVCLFVFNYVGMLLQPVMAGLPGGPQTEKTTTKQ